ncbi:Reverse transcriptase (RNA-dependent DNA polymerase) [Fragilaria crotonensis]|nr:Reverse transcriptase (RNA-dependent DNA polymerase) [Fragilaria crotonensis]KAI2502098.1 Reverse transcriptase (RNA-dependent DNA polymerase) [Fragilaria crotonensis]
MVTASTAERVIKAMSSGACVDRSEMDSHADTCVAGCNMVVLEDTGQTVSVTPFTSEYNALKGIPIVSAATAYDCPTDGETYLLIFNECLFLGERLPVSLLCPNQLRAFGLSVRDTLSNSMLTHRTIYPSRIRNCGFPWRWRAWSRTLHRGDQLTTRLPTARGWK